jgi:cell filamentation protein, protein adenylyltransferase
MASTRESHRGSSRAGAFRGDAGTYQSFVPKPLPPDPPLEIDQEMLAALSGADQALGRLDGVIQTIPNPDLFVAMYVRREAVLSSQIEGTQSTLQDLLAAELEPAAPGLPDDVEEVVNYVHAMNYGIDRLATLPLSKRLVREIHAELLRSGRGAHRMPGEFRRDQNWIGPEGAPIERATFIPPPVPQMHDALDDLERFLNEDHGLPVLVHVGLAHAQFETIHPFIDGNGRVGRLLITFQLVHRRILHRPLLYLSHYLKQNRAEYYDRLMAIRLRGDWEGWLRFFLRGVAQTATEATETAQSILALRERDRTAIQERTGLNGVRLHDLLFDRPLVNVNLVKDQLDVSFATANNLVAQFEEAGLLREITGGRRRRVFSYDRYLAVISEGDTPSRG